MCLKKEGQFMAVMAAVHWAVICACVWSDVVWRDSHSSCKSSPALLLKMEQHTILSLSICLPLSLWPPSLPHPCSYFYCLSILSVLLYLGCRFFPVSSVSAPSLLGLLLKPRPPHSLTDRESMTAALSQSPVAHGGPSSHNDEVINDLMSLLTHSPTETWGRLFFLCQGAPVVLL